MWTQRRFFQNSKAHLQGRTVNPLSLEERTAVAHGLGLKHLRGRFSEIRAGLGDRVVLHWEKDRVEFVLVGDHEAVRRFLKTV